VERLPGGWRAYRRWVNEQLAQRPAQLSYHVLCGPTGCGKTRLLQALAECGEQVLDLEALACHRGSLLGAVPGQAQPKQKWFESRVLAALMGFDRERPVWVESESKKIGALQIPPLLFSSIHSGRCFFVNTPMAERVRLWQDDYGHFAADPPALMSQLQYLRPLVGGEEIARWGALAEARQMPELFERLMRVHYDPAYQRSLAKHYPSLPAALMLALPSLQSIDLREVAARLRAAHGPPDGPH
jgi:tRNA 2-selenouridine synthase